MVFIQVAKKCNSSFFKTMNYMAKSSCQRMTARIVKFVTNVISPQKYNVIMIAETKRNKNILRRLL
jgi:hypothetical protein